MCGILALIHNNNYNLSQKNFIKINNLLSNRGPDHQGCINFKISNQNIKIGHTRLSILDLSILANQPMKSLSGRFIISFNGEIYNHYDLRKQLDLKHQINWKTSSDTETLVNLFEFYEFEDAINLIQGMFSFILFDKKDNKIFAVRDLAGEKPLYFSFSNNFFTFTSDLKTIIRLPNFIKEINEYALKKFLELNYVPSPVTIFKNIFKLPAANYIKINLNDFKHIKLNNYTDVLSNKNMEIKKWWNIDLNKNKKIESKDDVKSKIHYLLNKSVKQQLISDVPLGAFLSGGIDSSLIVSLMQKNQNNTKTFTIGYEDKEYDESKYANIVAKHLSTDHSCYNFSKNEIIEYIKYLPQVFSEPFSDSSQLPTLLVSKIAKEKVKVVLTGDGGDELFGGYNRYVYANKFWPIFNFLNPKLRNNIVYALINLTPPLFYKTISNLLKLNINKFSLNKIKSKIKLIDNEFSYYKILTQEWNFNDNIINYDMEDDDFYEIKSIFRNNNYSFESKMMISDFLTYLPDDILCKVDRSSMFFGLESRAPFLNKDIIEFSRNIPTNFNFLNGQNKLILKDILYQYVPKKIIDRPKMGFGVPIGRLIKNELKDWTNDILSTSICNSHGFFNFETVKKIKNQHFNNLVNNQHKLWSLIQFNQWYQEYYKQ
jgi:asparagine synthase (glutamine-hydrolysing)